MQAGPRVDFSTVPVWAMWESTGEDLLQADCHIGGTGGCRDTHCVFGGKAPGRARGFSPRACGCRSGRTGSDRQTRFQESAEEKQPPWFAFNVCVCGHRCRSSRPVPFDQATIRVARRQLRLDRARPRKPRGQVQSRIDTPKLSCQVSASSCVRLALSCFPSPACAAKHRCIYLLFLVRDAATR